MKLFLYMRIKQGGQDIRTPNLIYITIKKAIIWFNIWELAIKNKFKYEKSIYIKQNACPFQFAQNILLTFY